MRLRRPESGSRGREAGASRIFILSPGGAPPMENRHGARWCTFVLLGALAIAGDISPQQYQADVNYLASPELKGRATGSPELEKAADFISAKFKSFGLTPQQQAFPVITGAHLGPNNKLDNAARSDFQPFSFSSSGSITAPVVFAGYGITNPDHHYDDYAGIDVTGKLVLILRHDPKEGNEMSVHAALA